MEESIAFLLFKILLQYYYLRPRKKEGVVCRRVNGRQPGGYLAER